ncbi:MAG: glycosyltransferase family 39 protein, partial [Dehalococcoidales bacterium]|nr:glycosyltransferase family 39 protein [Dehalococcoidales bacterium]
MTWRVKRFAVVSIITLVLGLLASNKFWFPYDDGATLTSAELILRGCLPYRDFVTPYPPFHYYIIALLFKIFGVNHLVARLYVVLTYTVISTFTFYAATLFAGRFRKVAYLAWAACAMALVPRLGPTLSVNWTAFLFVYLSFALFYIFIKRRQSYLIFLSGITTGFALISKQDIGLYAVVAQFAVLIMMPVINRDGLRSGFSSLTS